MRCRCGQDWLQGKVYLGTVVFLATLSSARSDFAGLLKSLTFLHEGTLTRPARHLNILAATAYVECENCTRAKYAWANTIAQGNVAGNLDWFNFLFEEQSSNAAPTDWLEGVDFPGGDYRQSQTDVSTAQACATVCSSDPKCVAFTWTAAVTTGWGDCITQGQPCCFMKDVLPLPTYTPGIVSNDFCASS